MNDKWAKDMTNEIMDEWFGYDYNGDDKEELLEIILSVVLQYGLKANVKLIGSDLYQIGIL